MSNTVKINGSNEEYTLSSNIKIYALIDAGFKKTVNGNYTYEHPLYKDSPYNATAKLKMTINKELNHLTMVVTDINGLTKVNIFKNKQLVSMVELLQFVLKDLEEKEIIVEN